MIPKIIHYCWFGDQPKSQFIENCIASWKKYLPDFKIRSWSEDDLDIKAVPFIKQAYQLGKWAFVADYVRFIALYEEGGIYMDTDVEVLRPFNSNWFDYEFFSAHEYHPGLFDVAGRKKLNDSFLPLNLDENIDGFAILSAIMASKPKHPYVKDCIDFYNQIDFVKADGSIDYTKVIIGEVISKVALKYGYRYEDKQQILENNMLILPSNVLVGNSLLLNDASYAIHLINGSWLEKKGIEKFLHNMRNNYPKFYPVFSVINKIRLKLIRLINSE